MSKQKFPNCHCYLWRLIVVEEIFFVGYGPVVDSVCLVPVSVVHLQNQKPENVDHTGEPNKFVAVVAVTRLSLFCASNQSIPHDSRFIQSFVLLQLSLDPT